MKETPEQPASVDGPSEAVGSQLDQMVERFLTWPLPDSVCVDECACDAGCPDRSGTNLLTADEARQMIEHVIANT